MASSFVCKDSDGNGILEGDELRRLMGLHALAMKIAFEFDLTALVRDGGASDADSTLVRCVCAFFCCCFSALSFSPS